MAKLAKPAKAGTAKPQAAKQAAVQSNPKLDPTVAKALKAARAKWDSQKEESKKAGAGGDTTLSEGRHKCKLSDARIGVSSKGLFCVIDWTCVDGDETGEKAVRFYGLDTDEKITWFQRDLRTLGVEVDDMDLEQLPALCEEIKQLAPFARISVKQNGDYLNVRIDKLLAEDEAAGGEEEAPAEEEAAEEEAAEEASEEVVEEEAAEEEAEEETVDVGSRVSFPAGGKKHSGVITKILEDEGKVHCKSDLDKKTYGIPVDKLELLVETE